MSTVGVDAGAHPTPAGRPAGGLRIGHVRLGTAVVSGISVPGMIVTSVTNHTGGVIAFGVAATVAILCMMTASAVLAGAGLSGTGAAGAGPAGGRADEGIARQVEDTVAALVAAGAEEEKLRQLVRESYRLGRTAGPS
jgi:hypothetical protein